MYSIYTYEMQFKAWLSRGWGKSLLLHKSRIMKRETRKRCEIKRKKGER
jgi:hypothetical protein